MPHLVLEHSRELSERYDLAAFADDLFETASAHPVFASHPQAVKVRTLACDNVRSGVSPQTFAHLTVRMLSGRTIEAKSALAADLLQVLVRHLPDVGSLSVEPVDMDTNTYTKRVLKRT